METPPVAWLDRHRADALRELGEPGSPGGWHVRGAIVTGTRVLAPLIVDLPLPVVAHGDVQPWLKKLLAHKEKRRRRWTAVRRRSRLRAR